MVGNEEIKLTDDDTALPDMFMQGLDGEELEEEFDGLNQLSPQERMYIVLTFIRPRLLAVSQRVTEMDPFARHRFHEYKAYKLRKAIERKQNRRFKRAETVRSCCVLHPSFYSRVAMLMRTNSMLISKVRAKHHCNTIHRRSVEPTHCCCPCCTSCGRRAGVTGHC